MSKAISYSDLIVDNRIRAKLLRLFNILRCGKDHCFITKNVTLSGFRLHDVCTKCGKTINNRINPSFLKGGNDAK